MRALRGILSAAALIAFAALAASVCSASSSVARGESPYLVAWGMETKTFPGSGNGHDFIAVFDVTKPDFGHLVAMLPVPTRSHMAHHTNYWMPWNRMLFANDFTADTTYILDMHDLARPRIAGSFTDAGPYTLPHAFATLANGDVLATYQIKRGKEQTPGALVELDGRGHVLRTSAAADPRVDPYIRPYSLLVLPKIDRVVTTSAPMPPLTTKGPSKVVQVWRLSDLKRIKTIVLPETPGHAGARDFPDEARLLSDGKTVLVTTDGCGLYRLNGLAGTNPSAQFVYDFGSRFCPSAPTVIGHYWIQPCFGAHKVVAVDVRNPLHPVKTGSIAFGAHAYPHWVSSDPGTNRFAITGYGALYFQVSFASIDLRTGTLRLSSRSINFDRKWPDGWNGPAIPHAVLFVR